MTIPLLKAAILNPYRSMVPVGFYHKTKGHTGVDLGYKIGDTIPSPIGGKVLMTKVQTEMGNTLYLLHEATGDVWVFAHNSNFLHKAGAKIQRGDPLVVTGNTGSKTTKPHSHVELITHTPIIDVAEGGGGYVVMKGKKVFVADINKIMTRSLAGINGYNCDPILRLKALYAKYSIDNEGKQKGATPLPPYSF